MTRIIALALALTAPAMVLASSDTPMDPARMDQIRTKLTADGYEVRKIDVEDGEIEVYAMKDGARLELYLDADLNVVRAKTDD
ncbi:PepSY domain-containing protein [Thalassococcus sp. BH17M4-6]|uniref:PepSY domain-containing protein n=1 Tax=Thalassococcus sp. BH17M4-6 TaxID=3413148 RepID=UPI003BDB6843